VNGGDKIMSGLMTENINKCIQNLSKVVSAKAVASANMYGFRFFEVRLTDREKSYMGTVNIQLEVLKELNITKSINGFKKVQSWLDTPEGLEYAISVKKRVYERDLKKYSTRYEHSKQIGTK
jgi:hypothetical protein